MKGHVFWKPFETFAKSASGTSDSLLPADTTTAMLWMPANATAAASKKHKIATVQSPFDNPSSLMVQSRFREFQASISSSLAGLPGAPFKSRV